MRSSNIFGGMLTNMNGNIRSDFFNDARDKMLHKYCHLAESRSAEAKPNMKL